MTYLLLGEDEPKKNDRIETLKGQALRTPEARSFDGEIFYAAKLDPHDLRRSLLSLPAVAPQRFVLIHTCHKLTPRNKDVLLDFLKEEQDHVFLVLESSGWGPGDAFVKKLRPFVTIESFETAVPSNVFDMTRLISRGRSAEALKLLFDLFGEGQHPLQIMGALVWFWGKQRARLDRKRFERGLRTLQEADLNIKRSRVKPDHAVEFAVVKLSALLA